MSYQMTLRSVKTAVQDWRMRQCVCMFVRSPVGDDSSIPGVIEVCGIDETPDPNELLPINPSIYM